MTTGPETRLIARVRKQAKADGWLSFKWHGSGYSQAGVPDVVFMKDGRTIWIEFKASGGGVVTLIQKAIQQDILDHGGECYVCWSFDDAMIVLDD